MTASKKSIVLEYLEFTQLSNQLQLPPVVGPVLEYLEFTQLSNSLNALALGLAVLEYLEFTQLSNDYLVNYLKSSPYLCVNFL